MSLYKEVINLKVDENLAVMTDTGMVHCTYAAGFVDALTQVAPIALKAEARIKELEAVLSKFVNWTTDEASTKSLGDDVELWELAEKVLENK